MSVFRPPQENKQRNRKRLSRRGRNVMPRWGTENGKTKECSQVIKKGQFSEGKNRFSRWWFQIFFLFSPLLGEDFQFD